MAITVTQGLNSHRSRVAVFNVAFTTGTNYVTGGVPVDLTPLMKGPFAFADLTAPIFVTAHSSNGLVINYIPGATIANGLFQMFTTAGTEEVNGTNLNGISLAGLMVYGRNDN